MIQVLGRSNKVAGPGRTLYQRKQQECKESGVNLVEIDLLRGGAWVLAVPEHLVPASHRGPYRICTSRAGAESFGEVYRVSLREPLPTIKIPLRPTDADVPLNLQVLLEQCYQNGGYDEDIDYHVAPEPALEPAEARWAEGLLRKQRRPKGAAPHKPGPGSKLQRKRKPS